MFDFNDVCNIMMPMLGYYDLYKDKDLNEYRKELGLSRLNYSLNRKFSGNYGSSLKASLRI